MSDIINRVADANPASTSTANPFHDNHPLSQKHARRNEREENAIEQAARTKIALQSVEPSNKEEVRAQQLIVKGQQDQRNSEQILEQAQRENGKTRRRDSARATRAEQKANAEIDRGCATIEASSGYVLDYHNGHVSKVYKALPVREADVDRLRHEAEMRDPLGERVMRTMGHDSKSTADFLKGACYGSVNWPDIAEYKTSDKKTARQWGYMAGGLVNLAPVPFLPTITESVGLAAHCVHGMHKYLIEKGQQAPDQADIARRQAEKRDPAGVRIERTFGRVTKSVGDYFKGSAYGALCLPDKGEYPPDTKPTARQLGYASGHLAITSAPVPFLSMGTSVFGMTTHYIHDAHLRMIARQEKIDEQKHLALQQQTALAPEQLQHRPNHKQPSRLQNQA
jgi:hypothetical protein